MTTKAFYDGIRPIFRGSLRPSQKAGVDLVLATCRANRLPRQQTAYCLATAAWETGRKMQPVEENLNYSADRLKAVFGRRITQEKAAAVERKPEAIANAVYANRNGNGNEASGDGWRYRGRGLVQITGRENYRKVGDLLGFDLEGEPDIALDPVVSAKALVLGMRRGIFTGRSLDQVSEPATSVPDFTNDRAVVNGRDRAGDIAGIADQFYAALEDVDMLSESRIVQAAGNSQRASKTGIATSAVVAVGGVVDAVSSDPGQVVDAAYQARTLADLLPWAGSAVALLLMGLFIYQMVQAKRAESARREDHEATGV